MSIKKITNELLCRFITEIKQKENMNRIQVNLIDPLIDYTFSRLYPYLIVISVIFFLTFLLALSIFFLIIKKS